MFLILALLALPHQLHWRWAPVSPHLLFWVGVVVGVFWYAALRFNLTQRRFFLVFGLAGTFFGIPAALEIAGVIHPFGWLGRQLGALRPEVNAGAWFVGAILLGVVWAVNFVWSRTHLRARLDEGGLYVSRLGARADRYDLIGLKAETEPLDYAETFLAGIGSLTINTRTGSEIFRLHRVVHPYRVPWFPFIRGKLARILEMLSYSGKITTVAADREALLAAEEAGDLGDPGAAGIDATGDDEPNHDLDDAGSPEGDPPPDVR
ncbi:MAG: hypothetical protein PVI86_03955 [Phycisphaerae bacterium]